MNEPAHVPRNTPVYFDVQKHLFNAIPSTYESRMLARTAAELFSNNVQNTYQCADLFFQAKESPYAVSRFHVFDSLSRMLLATTDVKRNGDEATHVHVELPMDIVFYGTRQRVALEKNVQALVAAVQSEATTKPVVSAEHPQTAKWLEALL